MFCIENKEYEIYCNKNGKPSSYTKKAFRCDNVQKSAVKVKLKTVLAELVQYTVEDGSVRSDTINEFVDNYELHKMDPIDYILVNNYDLNKTIFVSADRDFKSMTAIKVLTA